MPNALLIVAAGKSSRFGGYPKALCDIGGKLNVENTIEKAKKYFGNIYLGLNVETYAKFNNLKLDAKILTIETGQGDALSLLKLLRLVKEDDHNIDNIYVCWGDAYFVDDTPFKEFASSNTEKNKYVVACSMDEKPYAWFDVDENNGIIRSHFKKDDGEIMEGIHDQSLFAFKLDNLIEKINEFKDTLGIVSEDYNPEDKREVKLLNLFIYLYGKNDPTKISIISKNKVLSFNSKEELDAIIKR